MASLTLRLVAALLLARPTRKRLPGSARQPTTIRVAAINAPRWSPKKRFVVSAFVQAHRMRRLLNALDLDAAGILESYPAQRVALRSPRWGVWAPQGNPGGPGQGLVRRRTPRRRRVRLRAGRTVRTPFARYAKVGGLKMGTVRLQVGKVSLPTAITHLPTVADDRANQWRDQVNAVARSLPTDGPALVLADVNRDPVAVCHELGRGWDVAARADVIVVLARDCDVVRFGTESRSYRGRIGDHSAVPWAELRPRTNLRKAHR